MLLRVFVRTAGGSLYSASAPQNPVYKLLLPNPDQPQSDQPLFQISKPNPNAPYWSMFYFAYAGHLIPPRRVEFGRISKNPPEAGGGTRVAITGKTDEEKAVWKSIGDGNEDGVEWIVLCAALAVLDDEIVAAAEKAGFPPGGPSGPRLRPPPPIGGGAPKMPMPPPSPQRARVVPPVAYPTELPKSASSNSLGQEGGRLPPPSPQRQRVAPPSQLQIGSQPGPGPFGPPSPSYAQPGRPHTPPQNRPMPPPGPHAPRGPPPPHQVPHGPPPPHMNGGPPPPQGPHGHHPQNWQHPPPAPRSAPPPAALQPHQPPVRQQSAPVPGPNGHVAMPPPRQASLATPGPAGPSRQPAGYQPSSRPAQARGFQLSDGPSPAAAASGGRMPFPGERSGSLPSPGGGAAGGESSAAARMVQREVEAKRLQKLRNAA